MAQRVEFNLSGISEKRPICAQFARGVALLPTSTKFESLNTYILNSNRIYVETLFIVSRPSRKLTSRVTAGCSIRDMI